MANVGTAIPIANTIELLGAAVAAHGVPLQTVASGNTVDFNVQYASAAASSVAGNAGVASFNSTQFTVDANGFVSVTGGSFAEFFQVDASTPPGTNPVAPNGSGIITVTGGQVAAGTTTNVIRTDSLAANTYTIQIQRSQAVASSTIGDNGVSHFNSTYFTVDANGFVSLSGTTVGQTITGNTGGALSPTAGNWNIVGTGSITTAGSGSTLTVQLTGLTNHDVLVGAGTATITNVSPSTAGFVLTSNGIAADPSFQAVSASGAITTITGNSGGAESPLAGNFNILGTGSITIVGSANTETVQLTGLIANSVLYGLGTATIGLVASGTTGQVLQTNTGAAPTYSTATYPSTTTINQILYSSASNTITGITAANNGTLISGTTGVPSWLANGTTGQILTATTGSPPSWANNSAANAILTITGNSGGAESPLANNFNILGTGSITVAGSANTETVQLTGLTNHNILIGAGTATITNVAPSATSGVPLISNGASSDPSFGTAVVAGGGTGDTSFTAYTPICGGTTTTGALQSVASIGTTGQVLTSNGAGALPTFQTISATGAFDKITVQVFNASGTYTPTSGMKYCTIELVGGGGGSGGCLAANAAQVSVSSGGGGGGGARKTVTAATIGASQTVTIGAAGAGGTAGFNAGGTGGTTSVGAIVSATGGVGGGPGAPAGAANTIFVAAGGAGGAGGTGTGGDVNFTGGAGGPSAESFTFGYILPGNGGQSYLGAATNYTGATNAGVAGVGPGSGAVGVGITNAGNTAGAAGGAGQVIITEFISI